MRIVILRPLKLGDFLTAVPAFRAVRRAYPQAEIVLAAPRAIEPLLDLIGGALDRVVDVHELTPLPAELHGADIGVDLHGCGPESHRILLAAHPQRLIAFRNDAVPESADGPAFDRGEHEVARWCRLLEHFGFAPDTRELDLAVPPDRVPQVARGATLLHPGAASESRRWPADRWIDVARAEQRLGRTVIVTGGPDEVDLARHIAGGASIPPEQVYAGRTTVRELAALVAAAGRVLCGDTGVAHLSTAYRTPRSTPSTSAPAPSRSP